MASVTAQRVWMWAKYRYWVCRLNEFRDSVREEQSSLDLLYLQAHARREACSAADYPRMYDAVLVLLSRRRAEFAREDWADDQLNSWKDANSRAEDVAALNTYLDESGIRDTLHPNASMEEDRQIEEALCDAETQLMEI